MLSQHKKTRSTSIWAVTNKTVRIETYTSKFWREKNFYRTDRDLSIVRQRRLMKAFAAIEFKRKWIMPYCSPTHLASEWRLLTLRSVTHIIYNRIIYIIRLRLCINHGNLAIFSNILRFFYTMSLSITRIIYKIRLYIMYVCHRSIYECQIGWWT